MNRNKYTRLIPAVVLCLLLMLCTVTAAADGGKTYTEGTLRYTFDGSTITVTGYFGTDEEVTVPSVIAGYAVSGIASGAFEGTAAKIVHIPSSVVTMHEDSFGPGVTVILQIDERPESVTAAQSEPDPDTAADSVPAADTAVPVGAESTGAPAVSVTEPASAAEPASVAADTAGEGNAVDTENTSGNGSRSGCASRFGSVLSVTVWLIPVLPVIIHVRKKSGEQ